MRGITRRVIAGTLIASMLLTSSVDILCVNASSMNQGESSAEQNQITEEMNNSIAMLNYMTVVNQQINDSSNSRLYLEEVYNSLINNTSPNAIDDRTQIQLGDMLNTIDQYRMIDVKRDRLQYIYEQNKEQDVR